MQAAKPGQTERVRLRQLTVLELELVLGPFHKLPLLRILLSRQLVGSDLRADRIVARSSVQGWPMLTVRSEIGPHQKPPRDFYREASHSAKTASVRKKRLRTPNCLSFLGRHEHDDEQEGRFNIDNYFFKVFAKQRLIAPPAFLVKSSGSRLKDSIMLKNRYF